MKLKLVEPLRDGHEKAKRNIMWELKHGIYKKAAG